MCVQIWNHPDILHQIISQRKDDNDLDIDDAKAADVGASSSRRSRARSSRITSAPSSQSLMSSTSHSRLTPAASSDSLLSTSSLTATPTPDSFVPGSQMSTASSTSSLVSLSRLHTTPSSESLMSEASRSQDIPGLKSETSESSGNIPPVCFPCLGMSDSSSDGVKFTINPGAESSNGGGVPHGEVVAGTAEDGVSKNWDTEDTVMKMMKDEPTSSQAVSDGATQLKPDSDQPAATGDAVANSNVTSASSAGHEMSAVASASDLKKESQAISYDWVSFYTYMVGHNNHASLYTYRVTITAVLDYEQEAST